MNEKHEIIENKQRLDYICYATCQYYKLNIPPGKPVVGLGLNYTGKSRLLYCKHPMGPRLCFSHDSCDFSMKNGQDLGWMPC